jgi:hypothetical protein
VLASFQKLRRSSLDLQEASGLSAVNFGVEPLVFFAGKRIARLRRFGGYSLSMTTSNLQTVKNVDNRQNEENSQNVDMFF